MAYSGTTAASSVANPPIKVSQGGLGRINAQTASTGGTGIQMWMYNSSNGTTDMFASNYFTDAYYLGMSQGDLVFCVCCTGSTVGIVIGVLGAVTTAGAALASTGSMITSTFG